jgi:coenzyme Q-binding protein COQ10
MPHHHETRFLPYTPEQLFDLVAGVEHYPAFLPWCKAVRIRERSDETIAADLIIGYKMIQETFASVVILNKPRTITVQYISGPLSHLTNKWDFRSRDDGCDLSFQVDFDFSSPLLRSMMNMFFDKALRKMVSAFETRAKELYKS